MATTPAPIHIKKELFVLACIEERLAVTKITAVCEH